MCGGIRPRSHYRESVKILQRGKRILETISFTCENRDLSLAKMENVPRYISSEKLQELCPGLFLYYDFLTEREENDLIEQLDTNGYWDDRLSRKVQHFGYEFDYASRKVLADHPLIPFPTLAQKVLDKISQEIDPTASTLNQLTINEYLPGQGISAHIDTHSCFGDMMLSVSLGGDIVFRFIPASAKLGRSLDERISIWLPRRCVLIMKAQSRFAFKHAIPLRKTDTVDGMVVKRERRISLTFRSVRLPSVCSCQWPDACDSQLLELEPTRIAVRVPLASSIGLSLQTPQPEEDDIQ
jgi:alkylated DNA repair dioxygenase AlkB